MEGRGRPPRSGDSVQTPVAAPPHRPGSPMLLLVGPPDPTGCWVQQALVLHARPWCRLSRMPLVLELASSDPRCTPRRSTSVHHRTKPRTTTAKLIPMGADERRARSRMDEKPLSESTKPSTSDGDGPWHQHQNVTRRAALVPKRDCQSRSSKVPCFIERLADLLTPWKSGGRRGSR